MPIFRVKSVKIYTGQKKIYMDAVRGVRDKYQVCVHIILLKMILTLKKGLNDLVDLRQRAT